MESKHQKILWKKAMEHQRFDKVAIVPKTELILDLPEETPWTLKYF